MGKLAVAEEERLSDGSYVNAEHRKVKANGKGREGR